MDDKKRGPDAQDRTATSRSRMPGERPDAPQDAPNYDKRTDAGQAIEVDNLNSANDEGAP